jgi:hypothetical protein
MKKTNQKIVVINEVATVKGRKTNPESMRQKRLAERAAKGEVKRGRPVSSTSVRQARIAELAAKRESGELKKGRPTNSESARQKRLAKVGTVKKGRPAKVKEVSDVVVAEVIEEVKAPVKKASKKK